VAGLAEIAAGSIAMGLGGESGSGTQPRVAASFRRKHARIGIKMSQGRYELHVEVLGEIAFCAEWLHLDSLNSKSNRDRVCEIVHNASRRRCVDAVIAGRAESNLAIQVRKLRPIRKPSSWGDNRFTHLTCASTARLTGTPGSSSLHGITVKVVKGMLPMMQAPLALMSTTFPVRTVTAVIWSGCADGFVDASQLKGKRRSRRRSTCTAQAVTGFCRRGYSPSGLVHR
jgi:hypothetical protein